MKNENLSPVPETMPCNPRDIRIGYWTLPATLDRAEREEAAARLLSFSLEANRWVGVPWRLITEAMVDEMDLARKIADAQVAQIFAMKRYQIDLTIYRILCVVTLGLYLIFGKKPVLQQVETPEGQMPMTAVPFVGPRFVAIGFKELEERGMIRIEMVEDDEVVFPTPTLIGRIMEKQGVPGLPTPV